MLIWWDFPTVDTGKKGIPRTCVELVPTGAWMQRNLSNIIPEGHKQTILKCKRLTSKTTIHQRTTFVLKFWVLRAMCFCAMELQFHMHCFNTHTHTVLTHTHTTFSACRGQGRGCVDVPWTRMCYKCYTIWLGLEYSMCTRCRCFAGPFLYFVGLLLQRHTFTDNRCVVFGCFGDVNVNTGRRSLQTKSFKS